jgi:hypothetical protein
MRDRQAQVSDAGPEVVLKAGERARKDIGTVGADAGRQLSGDRARGRLIAGGDPRFDPRALRPGERPQVGGDLGRKVAHPVCQAALTRRARKAFLNRRMIPGAPSETITSGSPSPRVRRSWKNARTLSTSSLDPAINPKRLLDLQKEIKKTIVFVT